MESSVEFLLGRPSTHSTNTRAQEDLSRHYLTFAPCMPQLLLSACASGLIMYSVLYASGRVDHRFQLASSPRAQITSAGNAKIQAFQQRTRVLLYLPTASCTTRHLGVGVAGLVARSSELAIGCHWLCSDLRPSRTSEPDVHDGGTHLVRRIQVFHWRWSITMTPALRDSA